MATAALTALLLGIGFTGCGSGGGTPIIGATTFGPCGPKWTYVSQVSTSVEIVTTPKKGSSAPVWVGGIAVLDKAETCMTGEFTVGAGQTTTYSLASNVTPGQVASLVRALRATGDFASVSTQRP